MTPQEELRLECLKLALLHRDANDPVTEALRMEQYVTGADQVKVELP